MNRPHDYISRCISIRYALKEKQRFSYPFGILLIILTAKECRGQCQVMCLSIPARPTHVLNAFKHPVWLGNLNI